MRDRKYNIDWKRNNKVACRNFNENVDFHDIVKLILVRLLRREHPNSSIIPIYTEYSPDNTNYEYPDIWIRLKEKQKCSIIVYEIQKKVTEKWKKETIERYKDVDLIIVPLKKLSHNTILLTKQLKRFIV